MFRYYHAFIEKAQHLRRWISLRTFTRGRLVPRQPRAIKSTTRTELYHEGIHIVKFIHWNINIAPTLLRGYNIQNSEHIHWNINITPTLLRGYNIQNSGYIHWNINITPTLLRGCNICNGGCIHWNIDIKPMALHRYNIRNGGYIHWEFTAIPMALHANTIPFCTSFIFHGYSL